jgi:putative MFS transporter
MLSDRGSNTRHTTAAATGAGQPAASPAQISARIDRLPPSRHIATTVARIGLGGWFEFYELFMAGYIALGLVGGGLFSEESTGYLDLHGYASFTASFFTGMFLSTALLSRVSDRYGRRAIFTVSMLGYSAAAVLVAFSTTAAWIDLWRFVAGFAIGIQLINNDTYMSEICPAPVRGRYMSAAYILVLTSVPVCALLSWQLVPRKPLGLDGWRWVMLIGAVGGVLVFLLRRRLPESPRWLAGRGRLDEADAAVRQLEQRVAAETGRPLPEPALENTVPVSAGDGAGGWREVFGRRYGGRTVLLSVFQFAQTIAVYGFANWAPILLVHRGFTIVHSLSYSFMIALLTPVGALVATVLSGRLQRKWQLVGAAVGIGAFGVLFAVAHSTVLVLVGGAGISLCNNWLIGAFHPYSSELFPTRIRSRALGFSYSWSRVSSVFVSYWIAGLLASYGTGAVFTMIGVAMAVIVLSVGVFGPGTDGRTLEDISP